MRKAAGIILIIAGITGLIGPVMGLPGIGVTFLYYIHVILWRFGAAGLLISGGVFWLKRRHWEACLLSALLAVFIGVASTIDYLGHIAALREHLIWDTALFSMFWGGWVMLLAGVISAAFVYLRESEWKEVSA